ncbi:MAG: NADH-quinone oxidoreductase subunit J [Actinobacteria bacterium]|nr:NADH-quinone oxidoreductase subunit J [Actinomycetota bacterium]
MLTFWVLAIASVAAALGMVLARRAVHCALLLAVVMLSLAVFYAMEGAPFLAFVQVIVYTGAVLMLFLFVLMIVGITAADSIIETIRGQRMWAALGGIAMLVLLSLTIGHAVIGPAGPNSAKFGNANVSALSNLLFTKYVYPFEITSALLITAAVGAMVLAHRERIRPKPTQRELAAQRIAGSHPTPLPGPGTYAQHNAVDMPALLPDGSQSELSVSPVLSGGGAPERPPAIGTPEPDGSHRGVTRRAESAAGPEAGEN